MVQLFSEVLKKGKRYARTRPLPIADIQLWDPRILSLRHHSPKKRAYLKNCSMYSLKKRWWVFCFEGAIFYIAFGLDLWFFVLTPVVMLLSAAYIVLDSRRRHLSDRMS